MTTPAKKGTAKKKKPKVEVFTTPKFRVSYPNLFKPQERDDGKPTYNLVMLFPKTKGVTKWRKDPALKGFWSLLRRAAIAKWGEDYAPCKFPFKDGDKKLLDGEPDPNYKGMWYAQAVSGTKPGVVGPDKSYLEESEVYPGMYARATVNAFAWMNQYKKKGVSLGLRNVQKWSDGERIGGFTPADEDFEALDDEGADDEDNYEDDDDINGYDEG